MIKAGRRDHRHGRTGCRCSYRASPQSGALLFIHATQRRVTGSTDGYHVDVAAGEDSIGIPRHLSLYDDTIGHNLGRYARRRMAVEPDPLAMRAGFDKSLLGRWRHAKGTKS